jgi:glycopeptide antibiotics resistance protein
LGIGKNVFSVYSVSPVYPVKAILGSACGVTATTLIFKLFNHLCKHSGRYLFSLLIVFLIVGLWPFNFTEKNNAVISPTGGLEIARHGTAYTALPAGKLQDLKQFAIHIDLTTSSDGLDSLEKIFGHFINQEDENIFLAQWKDGIELRVRTERNKAGMKFGEDGVLEKEKRAACLIIYDGQKIHLYKNGTLTRRDTRGPLSFSNWSAEYPLVIGTDATGRAQWKGTIYEIAVFDQALMPGEVQRYKGARQESRRHPVDDRPLIHYVFKQENTYETEFRGKKALAVRDLGKGETADLVIPEQFTPYQRFFFRWDPDWVRNWLDVAVNIVGFVPFGMLLTFAVAKKKCLSVLVPECLSEEIGESQVQRFKGSKVIGLVILTVVVGFGVSLAIEWLQAYLPSRDSSLRDLITNALGTAIGAITAAYLLRKRESVIGV